MINIHDYKEDILILIQSQIKPIKKRVIALEDENRKLKLARDTLAQSLVELTNILIANEEDTIAQLKGESK